MGNVLPEEAYAAALATLPGVTPAELRWLTDNDGGGSPSVAWDRIRRGVTAGRAGWSGQRRAQWRRAALDTEPAELLADCRGRQVEILTPRSPGYPDRLLTDPERPSVLFRAGRAEAVDLGRPTVTIVGTRNCTGYGRQVAQVLGRDLARAGVVVVSGLAAGIDAAAHQGALGQEGGVVGVAATSVDVAYPHSSRELWGRVINRGLLFSEKPPGYRANPRAFLHRNRLMAGLADAVVIVESHPKGGSLSTAAAATARGITVMAVPGPILTSASAGTNALIADGCPPVRDHVDVLVALNLARAAQGRTGELAEAAPLPPTKRAAAAERRRAVVRTARLQGQARLPAASERVRPDRRSPSRAEADLLDQIDVTPTRLEVILARTGRRPGELALALDGLEEAGMVEAGPGWWARTARA